MMKIIEEGYSGRYLVYVQRRVLVGTVVRSGPGGLWVAKTPDGDEEGRYADFMEACQALKRFDERLRTGL